MHVRMSPHEACWCELFTVGCLLHFCVGALRGGLAFWGEVGVEEGGGRGSLPRFRPPRRPVWTTPISLCGEQGLPAPQLGRVGGCAPVWGQGVTLWDCVRTQVSGIWRKSADSGLHGNGCIRRLCVTCARQALAGVHGRDELCGCHTGPPSVVEEGK